MQPREPAVPENVPLAHTPQTMSDVAEQLEVMALPAVHVVGAVQAVQATELLVAKPEADHVEPGTHAAIAHVCEVVFQA